MFNFIYKNLNLLFFGFLIAFASGFGQTFFISLFSQDFRDTFELTNTQFGSLWVDSFRMPADAPTRDGGIRCPSPARQWVSDFLGGDLAALDARLGV